MSIYRITRLKVLDSNQITTILEGMRKTIESMGADFIDVTSGDNDSVIIVARYPNESTMEAATATAQEAFGQMITRGAVDGSSIDQWIGHVTTSF